MSPTSVPPSRRAGNIRESVDKGGERANVEEQPTANRNEFNHHDETIPRPPMNGRVGTRDSEIGEKFTTARSSLDTRKSVAV